MPAGPAVAVAAPPGGWFDSAPGTPCAAAQPDVGSVPSTTGALQTAATFDALVGLERFRDRFDALEIDVGVAEAGVAVADDGFEDVGDAATSASICLM